MTQAEGPSRFRIFIAAGEDSGDLHAANLIRAMKGLHPEVWFEGFGGHRMEAAGCRLHADTLSLASMGLSWIQNAGAFLGLLRRFYLIIRRQPPDLLVLVDFPGFNFLLARLARWRGLRVAYYICPQIWAWAPWRRKKILRLTDLLMAILPFEVDYYRAPGREVIYVGHPLADALAGQPAPEALARKLRGEFAIPDDCLLIGLFPGSRREEARRLLPFYRETLKKMALPAGRHRILVSSCRPEFKTLIQESFRGFEPAVGIVDGDAHPLMAACDFAFVASGTATLELAYYQKPMIVFYRIGWLALMGFRILCTSPFISLVNILSGREVVPEEITCRDTSSEQAARAMRLIASTPEREACLQGLRDLRREIFHPGASRKAAETLWRFLQRWTAAPAPAAAPPSPAPRPGEETVPSRGAEGYNSG